MEIAKALILTGRRSDDRPWPTAPRKPKHLFPLANRPILLHSLDALRAAGLLEATILVEPEARAATERAIGDGSLKGLRVRCAEYVPAVGIGSALVAGQEFLSGEPVLVQQGDALLHERIHPHLALFAREGLDALALRLARPVGRIERSLESGYMLSRRAISILLARPDAAVNPVAGVRASGGLVRVQPVDGCLPGQGDQETLLECNRRMLERLIPGVEGASADECTFQGSVAVHRTARLQRTIVRGPVSIGPGARLTDAYVGPYTSIGAGVVLEGAEIEHSIVLDDAEIRFVGTRLESSVIGRGARIVRHFSLPNAIGMSVGDGAEVLLS